MTDIDLSSRERDPIEELLTWAERTAHWLHAELRAHQTTPRHTPNDSSYTLQDLLERRPPHLLIDACRERIRELLATRKKETQ